MDAVIGGVGSMKMEQDLVYNNSLVALFTLSDSKGMKAMHSLMVLCNLWFITTSVFALLRFEIPVHIVYYLLHFCRLGWYTQMAIYIWPRSVGQMPNLGKQRRKFLKYLVGSYPILLFKSIFVVSCFTASNFLNDNITPVQRILLLLGEPCDGIMMFLSLLELPFVIFLNLSTFAVANFCWLFVTRYQKYSKGETELYKKASDLGISLALLAFSALSFSILSNIITYTAKKGWRKESPRTVIRGLLEGLDRNNCELESYNDYLPPPVSERVP